VVTGRRLAQAALVGPMESIGWQSRAAGWFTWRCAPAFLGVMSVASATQHAAPGRAWIAPNLGLRDDRVERLVAELTGQKDEGYRARTTTGALGYVTPEQTYRQWLIDAASAADAAEEIATCVRDHGMPYLRRLADDPGLLLAEVRRHPGKGQSVGICRIVVVLVLNGEVVAAREIIQETRDRLAEIGPGAYANEVEQVLEALTRWLRHDP
jgi:hypothetical protein